MNRLRNARWVIAIVCGFVLSAPSWAGEDPPLPVPAYPNWTLRQIDQKTDAEGKSHGLLFQYVSDDSADKIVRFYETATKREATFSKISAMYTVYGSGGTMINVIGPDGGVLELDQAGEHVVKVWKSMVTIVQIGAVPR